MSDESAANTKPGEFNPGPDWTQDPSPSSEDADTSYEVWKFHSPAEDANFAERIFHARYMEFAGMLRKYPGCEILGATMNIDTWPHGFEVTAKVIIKKVR